MIYFNCDYLEGGHPKILEKMLSTNMEQLTGYSTDHYCDSARERIRRMQTFIFWWVAPKPI